MLRLGNLQAFTELTSEPCGDLSRLVQRYAGSTIMQIAFNKRAQTFKDPAITRVSARPGTWIGAPRS